MIIFRIANEPFSNDLSGEGAAIYGARWNTTGTRMLYTASSISLAILEALVHLPGRNFPPDQYLMKIEIPDNYEFIEITSGKIKSGWKDDFTYTQFMGDEFVRNNEHLLLRVPSAVVEEEYNFLVNPGHKDAKKIKIISAEKLELDKRLSMK